MYTLGLGVSDPRDRCRRQRSVCALRAPKLCDIFETLLDFVTQISQTPYNEFFAKSRIGAFMCFRKSHILYICMSTS